MAAPGVGASLDEEPLLIRRIAFLAAGERRWPWLVVVLLVLVVSAFEAAGAVLIFVLLGLVAGADEQMELPLLGDIRDLLPSWGETTTHIAVAGIVAGFFLLRAVVVLGRSYVQARLTQSAGARLATRLHSGYLAMPYELHLTLNSAQQIRNIHETVQQIIVDVFVQGTKALSGVIVIVALLTVLLVTAPLATLFVVLVLLPVVLLMNRLLRPRLETLGREAQDLAERSLRLAQESLRGLREIRVMGKGSYFDTRFAVVRSEFARNRYLRTTLRDIPSVTLETILVLLIAGVLVLTVMAGDAAVQALPVLGMFAYVGLRLKPSLDEVVHGVNSVRYARAGIDDLYADLRAMEAWGSSARNARTDTGASSLGFEDQIVLEGVTFTYLGATTPALRGVDLTIDCGSTVGFVGPTGGGKSTLVDVIIGLLSPQEGRVLIDGSDLREIRDAWFGQLGVVAQSPVLLDTTLEENIALGLRPHEIDQERLREAVRIAQLEDFVDELPGGLRTRVGEHGVMLSGGQRQRVAIARALYRKPDVLVLDEGTSALDNRTQARLMDDLLGLDPQRTVLMVAHRISTVEYCDLIHVVDEGAIAASGTYSELMRESHRFRQLVS